MRIIKNNQLIIIIIVGAIALAVGFGGGMFYQKSKSPQAAMMAQNGQSGGRFFQRFGNGQGAGARMFSGNSRPVAGEIVSVDTNGVTIKIPDGSTKIVVVSKSTSINKAASGTKDDLKEGEKIAVFGTTNSDGSVTAQSIQLNPQMRMFGTTPTPSK